jgi:hypothetical protein
VDEWNAKADHLFEGGQRLFKEHRYGRCGSLPAPASPRACGTNGWGTAGALRPGFDLRACYWFTGAFNVALEGFGFFDDALSFWTDLVARGLPATLSGSGRFAGPMRWKAGRG